MHFDDLFEAEWIYYNRRLNTIDEDTGLSDMINILGD